MRLYPQGKRIYRTYSLLLLTSCNACCLFHDRAFSPNELRLQYSCKIIFIICSSLASSLLCPKLGFAFRCCCYVPHGLDPSSEHVINIFHPSARYSFHGMLHVYVMETGNSLSNPQTCFVFRPGSLTLYRYGLS